MKTVSVDPVLQHMRKLRMSVPEIARQSGLPLTTVRSIAEHRRIRETTADKIMAIQLPPHITAINGHNRVECNCGYLSQRFGTYGLAKARARRHVNGED